MAFPVQARLVENIPPPPANPPIQLFFAHDPTVDGVPVFYEEWRTWDGRSWVPLLDENGQRVTFGLTQPYPYVPAPPVPKRQRRLE